MLYKFQCQTVDCVYNLNPCFLIDASDEVLCGGCRNKGIATKLEDQEIDVEESVITTTPE